MKKVSLEKVKEVWDEQISDYTELGNEGLYEGLSEVLNSPDILEEIQGITDEWMEDYEDEEEYDDMLEMNISDLCHYQIMSRFHSQLFKNLHKEGYELLGDNDWKLPNKRGVQTTYGIIWDEWGVDYDTNVREKIADDFECYLNLI
jgi:hypothetical protein